MIHMNHIPEEPVTTHFNKHKRKNQKVNIKPAIPQFNIYNTYIAI